MHVPVLFFFPYFFLIISFIFLSLVNRPFSIQTTHTVWMHSQVIVCAVHIVMPTCLIYCCTRIPKMVKITTPHTAMGALALVLLHFFLVFPLILCLNLIVIRNTFSRLANSSPFHIHVFVRFIKGKKLIVTQQWACSFCCFPLVVQSLPFANFLFVCSNQLRLLPFFPHTTYCELLSSLLDSLNRSHTEFMFHSFSSTIFVSIVFNLSRGLFFSSSRRCESFSMMHAHV